MLIGYARVSKTDDSQSLDLQRDALRAEGIDDAANLYHDFASGVRLPNRARSSDAKGGRRIHPQPIYRRYSLARYPISPQACVISDEPGGVLSWQAVFTVFLNASSFPE